MTKKIKVFGRIENERNEKRCVVDITTVMMIIVNPLWGNWRNLETYLVMTQIWGDAWNHSAIVQRAAWLLHIPARLRARTPTSAQQRLTLSKSRHTNVEKYILSFFSTLFASDALTICFFSLDTFHNPSSILSFQLTFTLSIQTQKRKRTIVQTKPTFLLQLTN